ncbi:hypothetical protein NP511_17930 [Natrinema thermotolerans]|uniref:Uncharacterized protein n=1 Tax=Natrinema thermotolerans TaxID=121872 RepID=A0AAF0PA14_9EURY|nr:hypothetical protein [Natrinema thermotolerans]QCC60238.1 hypothetical protein DVR14_17010 [Natrinema thermotolerans]QCC61150.1 hypothetical protein DVR14_21140 [Natrinema thermotolerans]WMT07255.1 hypothetical protein NP511_17930 [Natrinema thermotolerans]
MATEYQTQRRASRTVLVGGVLVVLGLLFTFASTTAQQIALLGIVGAVTGGSVRLVTQKIDEDPYGTLLMYGVGLIAPRVWLYDFGHDGQQFLVMTVGILGVAAVALASHIRFKTSYGLALGFGAGVAVSTVILYGV